MMVFSTLKVKVTIPCTCQRDLCFLGSKNYPKFYPRIFACFFSFLAVVRSTQSLLCFADLCWSCLAEAYLWFSSTCNRYHLCAHSKLALVLFASSERILQRQRDSLPQVSTAMSLTKRVCLCTISHQVRSLMISSMFASARRSC